MQSQPRRITSLDKNYHHGDLSVFPNAIDSIATLFEASNNTETTLRHKITTTSRYIILSDGFNFPGTGLAKISKPGAKSYEIFYYGLKINNQLHNLQRGYGRTNIMNWPAGSIVSCPVMSEHHNALKDAVIKIEHKIGTSNSTDNNTLFGTIRSLEQKWLVPKAIFKAFPRTGNLPLTVRFQNFSTGNNLKFLWDFGDGITSTEKSPMHQFLTEGEFDIRLNVMSSDAQALSEKTGYISVTRGNNYSFFYVKNKANKSFEFIDQTDGNIIERHWYFGDNTDLLINDPNIHTIIHDYQASGEYYPMLIVRYADKRVSKIVLPEGVIV